jgi:DNA-binding LacI/PurR family transcriptional regulator
MAKCLFALDDPPTAIFASSDTHAIGILDAAKEIGIKIPQELSVIGYDNIRDSAYNELTTIDQNLFDSGVRGAQILLSILERNIHQPYKEFVSLSLVERKTTAAPLV